MIDDEKANTIASQAIIDLLIARFPNTFRPSSQMKLPLKVGILADLTARCPMSMMRCCAWRCATTVAISPISSRYRHMAWSASISTARRQASSQRSNPLTHEAFYIAAYEKKNPAEAVASAG